MYGLYTTPRTRLKKYSIFNGVVNACSVADKTTLLQLQSSLTTAKTRLATLTNALPQIKSLVGKVGGCFIGRTLSHWYEKYPNIQALKLSYGQTQYCEPNFIDATIKLIEAEISGLNATIQNLSGAVATEQKNYDNAVAQYNNCLYLETQKSTADTSLATAQTTLTKAGTEQAQVIAEAEEKSTMAKILPFVLGAGVVGGAVYYFTRKKSRK